MIKVKNNKNKITKRKTRMNLVVFVGEGFKATPIHLIRFIMERIVKWGIQVSRDPLRRWPTRIYSSSLIKKTSPLDATSISHNLKPPRDSFLACLYLNLTVRWWNSLISMETLIWTATQLTHRRSIFWRTKIIWRTSEYLRISAAKSMMLDPT